MARADFKKKTKEVLALRAGHRCSFPGCAAVTVGPSTEGPEATSNSGDAAHIIAASGGPGARRVVPGTPIAELISIKNGIWLCATHARQVDRDEETYTIGMLRTWRELAERRAKIVHQLGQKEIDYHQFVDLTLPENELRFLQLGSENRIIGDALRNSCVPILWGKSGGDAVRDLLIELTRNAFDHGKATEVLIEITPHKIVISDDGTDFSHEALIGSQKPGGGFDTIQELMTAFSDQLLLSWQRHLDRNETTVSFLRVPAEALLVSNCAINLDQNAFRKSYEELGIEDCERVYLVMGPYPSVSDVRHLVLSNMGADKSREYILIVEREESSDLLVRTALNSGIKVMRV